jgi:trimethylamine--corrinoid protein Co-methyltransferase
MSDGSRQTPPKGYIGGQYQPLRQDQIGRIHQTALRILEEVGVRVQCEEARRILLAGGAAAADSPDAAGSESARIHIRPRIVERALNSAPSRIVLNGRSEEHDLIAEGSRTHFGTGGAAINVIDLQTGECRASRLKDIADFARLAEHLPNIHFFVRPCAAQDVPLEELAINEFYAALAYTTKHVLGSAYDPRGVRRLLELGSLIAGGRDEFLRRPFFSVIAAWMNSPLVFDTTGTEILLEAVRSHVPVMLSSAPMAGSTAPITLAGTLVQLHAEELAGLVLAQMAQPGAPVLYGGIPSMADLHHLSYLGGGVEFGMMNAAIAQLSHYINVPNYNSAGITEAKIPDIQAVYEKSFAILQCALSGSNIVHHAAGMLESLLTISHEQLVIDNEIIGMAMRAVRGIEVSEDTLAFDAIKEAASIGHFLYSEHTAEFMYSEYVVPSLADRRRRKDWEEMGMEDIRAKARRTALEVLQQDPGVTAITRELDRDIRERLPIHPFG